MSRELMDAMVAHVRKINSHHEEARVDGVINSLWMVYRGLVKKGFTERDAYNETVKFYQHQVKVEAAKIITDGQHKGHPHGTA